MPLCTPNVIVQEYVDGISGAELIKLKQEEGRDPKAHVAQKLGSDLEKQIEIFGYECFWGIFNLPRIQGDPHPGNVRFMTNDRVGLLDFGISAKSPKNKSALLALMQEYNKIYEGNFNLNKMYSQFIRFFVNDLYRALKRLNHFRPSEKQEDFTEIIGNFAGKAFEQLISSDEAKIKEMVEDGTILREINKALNNKNKFGLVMQIEAVDMLRAANTFLGLADALGQKKVAFSRVIPRVTKDIEASAEKIGIKEDHEATVTEAVETIASWLEKIAERDPALLSQLTKKLYNKENILEQNS